MMPFTNTVSRHIFIYQQLHLRWFESSGQHVSCYYFVVKRKKPGFYFGKVRVWNLQELCCQFQPLFSLVESGRCLKLVRREIYYHRCLSVLLLPEKISQVSGLCSAQIFPQLNIKKLDIRTWLWRDVAYYKVLLLQGQINTTQLRKGPLLKLQQNETCYLGLLPNEIRPGRHKGRLQNQY